MIMGCRALLGFVPFVTFAPIEKLVCITSGLTAARVREGF